MAVMQYPIANHVVNGVTAAATGSQTFTLQPSDSLSVMLSAAGGTGTTPTLDVSIQTSPDGGTTWFVVERFTQVTTSAAKETISFKPYLGVGDAATAFVSAATGGQAKQNIVCAKDMCITYTIGGTNPSFAIDAWVVYAGGQNSRGGI